MRIGLLKQRLPWPFRPTHTALVPAVSVVVPVFGTEDYLADCLASLLRQSFREIEVIVVDDASPGDVGGIVARVAGRDSRVKMVRHAENQGALMARLTGSRAAIGAYIAFVDSDDLVEDRFIELLHAAATQHDADLVQCAMTMVEADGKSRYLNRGGSAHVLHGLSVLAELLDGKMSNSVSNKLIRKTCWHAAISGLSAECGKIDFGEDLLCLFFVAAYSKAYVHIADAVYHYVPRAGSITKQKTEDSLVCRIRDLNRIFETISPLLRASGEPEELKARFFQREFLDVVQRAFDCAGRCNATDANDGPRDLGLLGSIVATKLGKHARAARSSEAGSPYQTPVAARAGSPKEP